MKKLFYLAIVLCAIACTNKKSSVNYAKFEPEDGKCLVFIGQDMEAIGGIEGKEGYVNFFGTPAGITIYTNIRPGDVSYGYTYQGLAVFRLELGVVYGRLLVCTSYSTKNYSEIK